MLDRYKEKINCKNCEIEIDKYASWVRNGKKVFSKDIRKFCSIKCSMAHRNKTGFKASKPTKEKFLFICGFCQKEEFVNKSDNIHKFCSNECLALEKKRRNGKKVSETPSIILDTTNIKNIMSVDEFNKIISQPQTQRSKTKQQLLKHFGSVCSACNKSYHYPALVFHHLSDKSFKIGDSGKRYESLIDECSKCIVLCANCHAIEHYNNRIVKSTQKESEKVKQRRRERKIALIALFGGCCQICGWSSEIIDTFSFDHLRDKKFTLGMCNLNRSWESIVEEAKKCQLLCINCHNIKNVFNNQERGTLISV